MLSSVTQSNAMVDHCQPDSAYVEIIMERLIEYEKRFEQFERPYDQFVERSVSPKPVSNDGHPLDDCPLDDLFEPICALVESSQTESADKVENMVSTLVESDAIVGHSPNERTANDENLFAAHRESDGVSVAESGSTAVANEPTTSMSTQVYDTQLISRFIESTLFNGQRLHRCVWPNCLYVSARKYSVIEHIHSRHAGAEPFKCPHQDCGRTFTYLGLYRQHLKYHLCGFTVDAIRYKYGYGLCSQYNIRQYIGRERLDEKVKGLYMYMYHCLWTECPFSTVHINSMRCHIHSHVCPFRRA